MLTSPVAAARGAVATEAWVKSKHDMYLIRGSVGAEALFLPIRRRIKKKRRKSAYLLPNINTLHLPLMLHLYRVLLLQSPKSVISSIHGTDHDLDHRLPNRDLDLTGQIYS